MEKDTLNNPAGTKLDKRSKRARARDKRKRFKRKWTARRVENQRNLRGSDE